MHITISNKNRDEKNKQTNEIHLNIEHNNRITIIRADIKIILHRERETNPIHERLENIGKRINKMAKLQFNKKRHNSYSQPRTN